MSEKENQKAKSLVDIEDVITSAIEKVGGDKENDLCKYLPMSSGGYMHHFTLRKMKLKQPFELGSLIKQFIIEKDAPNAVAPKQRAARGSKKRKDQMTFTRIQLERLLNIAKQTNDKEMISLLSPKTSLATAKRNLITSVRQGIVDEELWFAYKESAESYQFIQGTANQQFTGSDIE
ncbi:MAG: hypothetical protein SP4CHLAM5_08180 [Chlamydiia bacterium]|nr:hypothetical protein [Chlamydiia bacterium]MCH9618681.1 hypothetical protein [Chlamydiia bacterium]MCH9624416.1 hypothetical protein [Chlamydiia bacterium]